MKLKISVIFFLLALLLVIGVLKKDLLFSKNKSVEQQDVLKEFSKAEIFEFLLKSNLTSYSGQELIVDQAKLSSADVVTVHFWASWCAPCVNEVPELIDFAKRVSSRNSRDLTTMFITVSLDENSEELNKFLKSFPEFNKEPFVRLWDKDKSFSKLVNADRLPMTVILNKKISEPRIVRGVVEWKSVTF